MNETTTGVSIHNRSDTLAKRTSAVCSFVQRSQSGTVTSEEPTAVIQAPSIVEDLTKTSIVS